MTPTASEAAPDGAPPEKRGPGRILLGVVLWPRSTFAYLRDNGGRSWLWPVLLVAVLAVATRAVALPIEKAQADAALAAIQAQLNAQGQNGNGKGALFISTGSPGGLIGPANQASNPLLAYGLSVAGVAWDWLFRGSLLLGLAWLLGGRPAPGAMFRMSGWTLLPNGARLMVALAVMLIAHHEPIAGLQNFGTGPVVINVSSDGGAGQTGNLTVGPGGPGGLTGPSFLDLLRTAFLSALDVYTFWGLVLMLIGVAVTARLGWLKAAISTAGFWVLSLVLATLPPLLSFLLLTVARPGNIVGP